MLLAAVGQRLHRLITTPGLWCCPPFKELGPREDDGKVPGMAWILV